MPTSELIEPAHPAQASSSVLRTCAGQRTMADAHSDQGLRSDSDFGSTAATRTYTFDPDGKPPSVYLDRVLGWGAEYVAAFAGSVACCVTNPCVAPPFF